jgi:DNA-3-methyladenine glycosylase II
MSPSVRTSLVPPPLASFAQTREQLERSSRSVVYARDGGRLLRSWGPPDRPFAVAIEPDGSRWSVEGWGVSAAGARRAVREMFSLDDPLEGFYRQTRAEPALRGTERMFRGLRLPRDPSLYEALLHSIVGQQVSVAAANAIKARLLARYADPLDARGIEVPTVPSPAALRRAGVRGLRSVGLSRAKSRAVVGLARWGDGGATRGWRERDREEALEELSRLPGVGRWTAENALLRGAGRRDVFVAGDLGVRVALARFGAIPRSAPEDRVRAWAEARYPGWGSYATLYLRRKLVASNPRAAG